METRLCRICGKLGQSFANIFHTEGLKNKIETCLPVVLSEHSLLPDTICGQCVENVDNFYSFIKSCLQNIIILEAQYDVTESCLKTKRKHDKGCYTDLTSTHYDQQCQTEDYLDRFLSEHSHYTGFDITPSPPSKLVEYEINSDSEVDELTNPEINPHKLPLSLDHFTRKYFDDAENDLISEISQRKKRKCDDVIEYSRTKIFKMDTGNSRRKSRQPKKVLNDFGTSAADNTLHSVDNGISLLQVCLLCEDTFSGPTTLASHLFEIHGIDMATLVNSDLNSAENRRKKLPDLLKITDLKRAEQLNGAEDNHEANNIDVAIPSHSCTLCPSTFTTNSDLFAHFYTKHPDESSYLCGICMYQAATFPSLQAHLDDCSLRHPTTSTHYRCQVCRYGDDNVKSLENHVLVHKFLIETCRKQARIFDPADYVERIAGSSSNSTLRNVTCTECDLEFATFKEFTAHRRNEHSVFHCDLCNKFYGRNSHLWKHVNRLHKGHPSVTCQVCFKTSASKYHLAQHFNKIHSAKSCKTKNIDALTTPETQSDDFMSQKFQGFDFQSVKQSFMRQELLQKKLGKIATNSDTNEPPPKEIDASSDLYTNIITNYTPPSNEGDFKCGKCGKGFHKKTLVKKHRKNCRPRLQKDLLTRCKSCARIFKDRQSLAKHLVNYHSEYACEICQQKVQSKCEIVSHIRFSHPNCHLVCHLCQNVMRSQNDLDVHLRDHLNSYVCQFCADPLPSKIKLKMHILSLHRKILSLSCGVCLKLFETQHVLRDHVRLVHKDQLTPLTSCTVCGKNYGSKWKTYDHLNKSHGRIFRACKACLEVFDNESDLQTHYDSVHNVAKAPQTIQTGVNVSESEENNEKSESSDTESPVETKPNSKLSLLEKRLLSTNDTKPCPNASKELKNSVKSEDIDENSPNPQQSTKRTVYVNSNDPSLCEICQKTWPAKKHLWQHYIRCHKSVAATVCGICLKTNDSYEMLQKHLTSNHPHLLHGQGFGSNFICRICGRYHNASSKLNLHMAIHENFDWSLLNEPSKDEQSEDETIIKEENGYNSDINYESLIEQVECSSATESGEDELKLVKNSTSEDEDGDSEEERSDNSMQTGTLEENGDKISSSDDSSNSSYSDEEKSTDDSIESNSSSNAFFDTPKTEELDSAVQSIKYECVEQMEDEMEIEHYVELPMQSLNENEIESAVGSIL